jgi:hypothetical protein
MTTAAEKPKGRHEKLRYAKAFRPEGLSYWRLSYRWRKAAASWRTQNYFLGGRNFLSMEAMTT